LTHRSWLLTAAVALAACGGTSRTSSAQSSVSPAQDVAAAAAEATVQGFMQAVADSNLAKMADLWGSAKGPASKTKEPKDYERRIVVMQAYLRESPHRIVSNQQEGTNASRRVVQVEMERDKCSKMVPFLLVKAGNGAWLINSIDLAILGSPGANCNPEDEKD
jgi:hypothetical protein